LAKNPNHADALYTKASVLLHLNKKQEAIAVYDSLIKQFASNPPAQVPLHVIHFSKGNTYASNSKEFF
jgi:TolA-binding protein